MIFILIAAVFLCHIPEYGAECDNPMSRVYMPGDDEALNICWGRKANEGCAPGPFCVKTFWNGLPACCAHSCKCSERPMPLWKTFIYQAEYNSRDKEAGPLSIELFGVRFRSSTFLNINSYKFMLGGGYN
uniref:Uncharacterized protein n=1 Tax=Romanomermis culicivorax TaxID=13658 RepID=A0A915HNT5_ROMCU